MNNANRVFEIINVLSGAENITESCELINDLGMDSIEMVALLIEIEEGFDIRLDESDMNPFDLITVGDVVKLVDKYFNRDHSHG